MRMKFLVLVLLIASAGAAHAAMKSLMLTNRSGEAVTAIAASDRSNPEAVIAVTLANAIANNETTVFSIDLPNGISLADLSYTLSSSGVTTQNDIDLCNLDGVVVE